MGIEYSEVAKLSNNMQRAADYAPRIVDTWLHRQVGPALVKEMQAEAPVKSGHLRSQIRQIDSPRKVTVMPVGVEYNQYVVQGTKPHVIRAKRSKALAWDQHGKKMVRRQVNHPGTKPNPYMTDSAKKVMDQYTAQLAGLTIKMMKTGNV